MHNSGHFIPFKGYILVVAPNELYHCFLDKAPRISGKRSIQHEVWERSDKLKSTDILDFQNAMYQVLHEKSNTATFLAERLQLPE